MLDLRAVDGAYGEILAVRKLNLTLHPGETLAVIGRNGAGKSTTLRLIAGVLQPRAGDIQWRGVSIVGTRPEQRARTGIALVPEGRGVFPALTVEENLRMGAYSDKPRGKALTRRFDEVYGLLPRLSDLQRRLAGNLSGGEQQLLAIGRALMSHPEVLLLDEPSLGLSPIMVDRVYEVLHALKQRADVAIILVEQYVHLALDLCDWAIGLEKGYTVMSGPASEIAAQRDLSAVYMGGAELPVGH